MFLQKYTFLEVHCIVLAVNHEATSDEMERLYIHIKQANLSPIGDRKPSTKRDFRASFIKRCKNQDINEKLHLIRTLNSTLKVHLPTWLDLLYAFVFISLSPHRWQYQIVVLVFCTNCMCCLCIILNSIETLEHRYTLFPFDSGQGGRPVDHRAGAVRTHPIQIQGMEKSQHTSAPGDLSQAWTPGGSRGRALRSSSSQCHCCPLCRDQFIMD